MPFEIQASILAVIDEVSNHTYLGLKFSNNLRWNHHIDDISKKAKKKLNMMTPLKYKLDRHSLETLYSSFVLPTMTYAIEVWGGTYDSDMLKLEKIHVDGMRLITGATAKSNIANLYSETSWQTFSGKRDDSMLKMFYKIKSNIAPGYLAELLPAPNPNAVRYNLRNAANQPSIFCRLESFRRSFIPYAIKLWNEIPIQYRSIGTLEEFKMFLHERKKEKNLLYYYGKRWPQIHHCRMRLGCSKLQADLCFNLRVIDNPMCACGTEIETASHFFLKCEAYSDLRYELFNRIAPYCAVSINTILFGNCDVSEDINLAIFDAVHDFIQQSKKFE